MSSKPEALACPECGARGDGDERFCRRCGMPLVAAGGAPLEAPLSERHGRARKIDPRYVEGRLVRVAGGRNQAEAELIQGLLLEEGVPSMLRRSAGFDVPDFLAAGPRDVLVPASAAEAARELLHEAELGPAPAAHDPTPAPMAVRGRALRLAASVVGGGALAALAAWLLIELAG